VPRHGVTFKTEKEYRRFLKMATKQKTESIRDTIYPGIPINDFVKLVDEVTKKKGEGVMVSEAGKDYKMHLTLNEKHIGYISLITGKLVWDVGEP
jgi:hypothetical protein